MDKAYLMFYFDITDYMSKNRALYLYVPHYTDLIRGILVWIAEIVLFVYYIIFFFMGPQENISQLLLDLYSGHMIGSNQENVSRNDLC